MKKVVAATDTKLTPGIIKLEINGYNSVTISCPGYNSESYSVRSNRGIANALVDFLDGRDEVNKRRRSRNEDY